ncbi:MAG: response regulator [Luteitalea sp.]|nr:response regulator [Luteitalea sp.]
MGHRILIVDDDPGLREMMAMALAEEGFDTDLAGNGEDALERARARPPCVIVLDMMMPVMDGWMFRAHQRYDPILSSIPVVILTAVPVARLKRVGAAAALQKPFDHQLFISTVHAHCWPSFSSRENCRSCGTDAARAPER